MNAVETALYARLSGTAALTALLASATAIYNGVAPQNADFPYVVFSQQSAVDDNKSPHRARQLLYLVKAVVVDRQGSTSYSMQDAGAVDDQIDAALHGEVLTVTGWTNYSLWRETDVRFTEVPDQAGGRRYFHAGGVYRLRIAK